MVAQVCTKFLTQHIDGSGVMQTGWVKLGNNWHYFGKSGAMQKYNNSDGYYVDQGYLGDYKKYLCHNRTITIDKAEAVPEATYQKKQYMKLQVQQMEQILQK